MHVLKAVLSSDINNGTVKFYKEVQFLKAFCYIVVTAFIYKVVNFVQFKKHESIIVLH